MPEKKKIKLGDYALSEIVRRVRRTADLSQRELAKYAEVSSSMIGDVEAGSAVPSLPVLQRILNAANYQLVVVDASGRLVLPLQVWDGVADLAGRRFPAHLDLIADPVQGDWWADAYGLARPPETFWRDRKRRDYERQLSRWEVRVAKLRNEPMPRPPFEWPPYWRRPGSPPPRADSA
jgi:transcriptional regulator with XRE-family HTH domain